MISYRLRSAGSAQSAIDSYTKFLSHFDGTSLVDECGNTMTITGNAALSSTQSKFGGKSLYLPLTGDVVDIPYTTDFSFGKEAFTIDFWLYIPTSQTSDGQIIRVNYNTSTSYGGIGINYMSNNINLYISYNGTAWASPTPTNNNSSTFPIGAWTHVAVVRTASSSVKVYYGGVLRKTYATGTNSLYAGISTSITRINGASAGHTFYIDELRISKGIARWTADFTPPTSPY